MTNKIRYSVYILFSVFALTSCAEKVVGDLVLTNGNIVDVETGKISYGRDVVIVENKIHSIVPSINTVNYVAENIIDCSDKYLVPGLWDMHTHLSMIGKESIPLFVLNGVTGVRDMGGNWSDLKEWRKQGNVTNQTMYPKIKTAGPILESPQFYNLLKQILGSNYVQDRISIHSEERAKNVVDSLRTMGVDLIKVRTVKSQAIFKAISAACKENGIPFTGHIDQNIGVEFAAENGIVSIEHDVFLQSLDMDKEKLDNTLQAIKDSKLYFTPTMLATNNYRLRPKEELIQLAIDSLNKHLEYRQYLSPKLIENWNIQLAVQALENPMEWDSLMAPLRSFAKSIAANTTILSGTDCGVTGVLPGKGLHEELVLLVKEMDLSNVQALQATTINAVQNLGLQNQYGLLKPNYTADILILNENPLDDISNTSNIFSIVKNGNILDQKKRQERFKSIADDVRKTTNTYNPEALVHLKEILNKMNLETN